MKRKQVVNEEDRLDFCRILYEAPVCEVIAIESEGAFLSGSFAETEDIGVDDMPIENW